MANNYLTEIEKLFEKQITSEWLEKKSNQFIKLDEYDDDEQKVIIRNFENNKTLDEKEPFLYEEFVDEETGKKYTYEIENVIKEERIEVESTIITVGDFCWCSNPEKEEYQSFDYVNSKKSFDLEDLMYQIVKILKDEIEGCEKISSYNMLFQAISIIQSFFSGVILKPEFKEHQDLLINLNTQCANYIRFQFQNIFKNHANNYLNTETLDFYLDRNQLAGLIHLIIESELLEPLGKKTKQRIGKLDFFEKYFRWTDLKTNEKKKLTHLSSEITKIKSLDRAEGFHKVFQTLLKTYNAIIYPPPNS